MLQSCQFFKFVEIAVIGSQTALILLIGWSRLVGGDDGKYELRFCSAVAVDDLLYATLDLYHDLLSGLVPFVDDHAITYLVLAQKGHVDKRHALSIETKEEDVAR